MGVEVTRESEARVTELRFFRIWSWDGIPHNRQEPRMLHLREAWRNSGLGSGPESWDDPRKNWASIAKRGNIFNKEGALAVVEAAEKKDEDVKPKIKTFGKLSLKVSHILIFFFKIFLLNCIWFMMLCQFLLYHKVTQSYICVYIYVCVCIDICIHILLKYYFPSLSQEVGHSFLCCIVRLAVHPF